MATPSLDSMLTWRLPYALRHHLLKACQRDISILVRDTNGHRLQDR